jgi:epoxyqueuosine reductase
MKNQVDLTTKIKEIVLSSGFDLVGVSKAQKLTESVFLVDWLENDFHGDMKYMENPEKRSDVRRIAPSFKSVISCAINYNSLNERKNSLDANSRSKGWISRYAIGDDYHKIIEKKLKNIVTQISDLFANEIGTTSYVDTGPVLERAYASLSGLGWIGKNSCLINKDEGSWVFLSNILIDQELTYDTKTARDLCGSCTKCIDACPTSAIVEEKVIDARKCISYLTIENKKYIENNLALKFRNNLYGCDICQEVCPWNKRATICELGDFNPRNELIEPDILSLILMVEEDWDRLKIKSPLKRVKKDGLIRNILIVMGNLPSKRYLSILEKYLKSENLIHSMTARDSIERIRIRMVS